jgi:hypothetical protein
MYMYLNSNSSSELFRSNSPADFIYKLPRRLTLRNEYTFSGGSLSDAGDWEVALTDLRTPRFERAHSPQSVTLLCNICEVSVFENDMKPVLTTIHRSRAEVGTVKPIIVEITNPKYVRVTERTIESISLLLIDETGRVASFESEELRCTLHFRPMRK